MRTVVTAQLTEVPADTITEYPVLSQDEAKRIAMLLAQKSAIWATPEMLKFVDEYRLTTPKLIANVLAEVFVVGIEENVSHDIIVKAVAETFKAIGAEFNSETLTKAGVLLG